ncbi:MAG: PAS domain S-box protein, partial [Candidatus Lokiarchaeota archaeon]|nr:PAS domain S-box protein [Candidatus Lokiarchaeota archaeon]MBD3198924.1 PAS domain S-box protein [Candidatus Lokiarchaeota archaeon]
MLIFAILSLLSTLLAFFIGVFVYAKDTKNELNIIFMLFCLSFCIIGIAEYGMRQTELYEIAFFWSKFANLNLLPINFLFHFAIIFSNRFKNRKKLLIPLIYIPLLGFVLINFITPILDKPPTLKYWGWTYGTPDESIILNIYYLLEFFLVILVFILFIESYFSKKEKLKKNQAKYILIGFLIVLIIYLTFDYFNIQLFGYDLPEFGVIGFTICSAFIAFAIRKYDLFQLNLENTAHSIIKNLSDSLFLTDLSGNIIAFNSVSQYLLNYNKMELEEMNINQIISKFNKHQTFLDKFLNFSYENCELKDIEVNYKTKSKVNIPMSLSISLITDPRLEYPKGIIYIARDISKRKVVEQKLKKLLKKQKNYIDEILKTSKFKTQFISTMSHELRTPLNSIIGFSDLLLEKVYGEINPMQQEFLNDIKSSSQHLLNMINDMLDISKIEGGNLKLKLKSISLKSLIMGLKSRFSLQMKKKGLYLKIGRYDENKTIYVDPIRIKEIFSNLLTNAIKYTPQGGVSIKTENSKKFWLFS